MKYYNEEISSWLRNRGVDVVKFVNISSFDKSQNFSYPNAILFLICLSPSYMKEVAETPDYVQKRINNGFDFDDDEFLIKYNKTCDLSDELAKIITEKGFSAYSQSDSNHIKNGFYDGLYGATPLPDKSIATLAGIGWIGKNNLLVTYEYGSGFCMGTILSDIPLITDNNEHIILSECGDCRECLDTCKVNILKGKIWDIETTRDEMIDAHKCITCMQCVVSCMWTQKYIRKNMHQL